MHYGNQNLFPNYLLGLPDSYLQGSAQTEDVRGNSVYLFAQDSWKIKPNLTLNYGLRWEFNQPLYDAGGTLSDLPAGPGYDHISLPAQCREPGNTRISGQQLQSRRFRRSRISARLGCAR